MGFHLVFWFQPIFKLNFKPVEPHMVLDFKNEHFTLFYYVIFNLYHYMRLDYITLETRLCIFIKRWQMTALRCYLENKNQCTDILLIKINHLVFFNWNLRWASANHVF